jgi:hypothetical protein
VRIENNTKKQMEENVEENMHPERFSVEFGVQRIYFLVLPQELNSTMVRREACSAILL